MTSGHLGSQAERDNDDLALRRQLPPLADHHQLNGATTPPCPVVRPLMEPLSVSEMRVLQYLPTHLIMALIAGELYVSLNERPAQDSNLRTALKEAVRHGGTSKMNAISSGRCRRRCQCYRPVEPPPLRGPLADRRHHPNR